MVEDYINRTAEGARLDEAIARKKAELAAIEAKPPTEVKPRIEPSKPKSFIDEINNKDLEPKSIRLPPGTPSPVADPRKSGTAGMPAPSPIARSSQGGGRQCRDQDRQFRGQAGDS